MGGKALKNVTTRRYTKDEFFKTWNTLSPRLRASLNCRVDLVKCYDNKESHGDMDILVEYDPHDTTDLETKLEVIEIIIQPEEIFRNSTVVSMNYGDLQVDIMFIPYDKYDICYHFFAFNDLGGFMGKIARSMKLQYGQDGLKYRVYSEDGSRKLGTAYISKDPKEIIEFLGFDYYEFVRGFNTKEEIFEFICSSKYFRISTFDGSELNSSQKSRDMGRPMYQDLLEYIYKEKKLDKINERSTLEDTFNRVYTKWNISLDTYTHTKRMVDKSVLAAKKLLNGKHVMLRYNLNPGKLVGQLMSNWTNVDHFWINRQTTETLWKYFEEINYDLLKEEGLI